MKEKIAFWFSAFLFGALAVPTVLMLILTSWMLFISFIKYVLN